MDKKRCNTARMCRKDAIESTKVSASTRYRVGEVEIRKVKSRGRS